MAEDQERRREFEAELGLRPRWERPNPGITWQWAIDLVAKFLGVIVREATPWVREELSEFLTVRYKKALESPNPWDDMVYRVLLIISGTPIPKED